MPQFSQDHHIKTYGPHGVDREELFERSLGNDVTVALAREEDIDDIAYFMSLFGFFRSNSRGAPNLPFYVSPSLPLGAYSETDIRSHLFKYTAAFFLLRKCDTPSALLSFRFPLPQYSYRAAVLELILSLYPKTVPHPILSALLNFAFDCLPGVALVECTKVKGLVVKRSKGIRRICDFFIHNGFSKESTLRDEFGPKKDVIIFSRWFTQRGQQRI
ncbi:MAG: hypothetical protein JSV84_13930 [Gemmatimonadota bacterium]|nr:MAG: hypothetical protein JSV84_13930 [Gemmatimonadota bacterium]